MSFGYVKEDGLLVSDDMGYKRYNLRSNLTTELYERLSKLSLKAESLADSLEKK